MSSIGIIFNGIHFYQPVAEKAFNFAKVSGEAVVAIFVLARHEQDKGYGFPSDLDAAESLSSGTDADRDDRKIIDSNIKLLEHEAVSAKVQLHARTMEDPLADDFLAALEGCSILFMQGDNKEYHDHIPAGVNVKKLLNRNHIPIEIVF